jgi:uncharacterized damage-inducible protein DinB
MKSQWIGSLVLCAAMYAPALLAQSMPGTTAKQTTDATAGMSDQTPPAQVYGKLASMIFGEVTGAIEAMPEDKFNYAPSGSGFSGVRTFAEQVKHITQANYGFFSAFGVSGAMDESKIKALKSKSEIVAAWKDSVNYAQKAIATITPQNAFGAVGSGERKGTRAGMASFCLAHAMDHYGQMVEYLRMNEIVPPASKK